MNTPPILSLEQRRQALVKAAESRKVRATFKSEIRSGDKHWKEAFTSSDEAIRKMRVKELFLAIPGFGQVRVNTLMERAGISATRRIQGVGRSQYENLLKLLKEDS